VVIRADHAIDDGPLLRGAAAGDWQCIAILYGRHRDAAVSVATRVLADPSEAEDVVHDAFVDLPRMARTFDSRRGRPRQWLYRSIRNRAIDHLRRRSRAVSRTAPSARGPEAVLEVVPAREASPLDEAEAHELFELIDLLDGRQARLIRLAFVDGWSHAAIARMTGLPLGTVKTRIRNGLRQLRPLVAGPAGAIGADPAAVGIHSPGVARTKEGRPPRTRRSASRDGAEVRRWQHA
jgi:RNA polymerase sigma-70 factor, ECF subfamily